MSISITAMAIPQVACSSWENIDAHLTRTDSWDWQHLRKPLLRAVCAHQRKCGIPISADDELALIALYDSPTSPASFVAAWWELQANK